MRLLQKFCGDRRGATAVEYGVLAAILAVSLVVALGGYYEVMNNVFTGISNTYKNSGVSS